MNMKKIYQRCLRIMFVATLILVFSCFVSTVLVNAAEKENYLITDKIYADVDINDDFDETSVIVVLDSIVSEINKDHSSTIFKDINYLEIIDLTFVNDITTIIDIENFEQILKIKLSNPGKENVINMINELSLINGIKYAGPNRYLKVEQQPNDPLYSSTISDLKGQWAHGNIDSELAWNFTTGIDEVRVGVIDSGVSIHGDLNANVVTGYDFTNMIDDETPGTLRDDVSGHGTHVAGIIGAVGNQISPLGVVGVNWDISIVPMQVGLPNGDIDGAACVSAINFARELWNTDERISVLSMSISSYRGWPEIESAIRRYQGLFVCSTGNREQDNDVSGQYNYPAFYGSTLHSNPLSNLISVGRIDINNDKPLNAQANWGQQTISIYAPGQYILSTYPELICQTHNDVFYDGTRMCEFSIENRLILYSYIDSGLFTLNYILENFNLVFGYAPSRYVASDHHSDGYHYMTGSSMSTPYVAGVAALLLSLNEELTPVQLKQAILEGAEDITITVPDTSNGAKDGDTVEQDVLKLNAYNAVKYVLKNYSNTSYTLSNYSSAINTNKTIASDASYFNELNGFYKLNVTYAKNYEFISSSASGIEVTLYDENFTEISFNDLDSTINKVHFVKNLSVGTYYLRTKYISENSTGTINTKIISRNTAYLTVGENDILINSYNGFRDYNFTNQNKPGFFKFAFVGEKEDGSLIVYPSNAIKIYNDSNKTQLLQKFDLGGYDNSASLKQNEDNMYVYLPRSGYFYLDVNFNTAGLKSLKLVITEATADSLNLFDLSENTNETINVINENKKGDYFKALHLKQTGKFTVNFNYSGIQSNNILVVLTKQNYNETTREYSLDTKVIAFLNKDNPTYTYSASLEDGMYYIGYFNKADTSTVTATFERLVTQSGSEVLVTDPDQGTLCGSQINIIERNHSNKSYRQSFITVGFTRLIYPNYNYGISPSRLDYDWYSSNTSIATITNYGTVLGKSAGTVKIMAVLKSDPSKVFVKEFTIINDIGSGIVEIHSTYTVKYSRDVVNGKFHFDMEKINCPYPWLQDYTWSLNNNCHGNSIGASMDNWGDITINGTGCFTLTGTYNVNSRYRVIIHFVIEP